MPALSRESTSVLRALGEDARGQRCPRPAYSVFTAVAVASASPQIGDLEPSPQLRGR